MSRAFGALFAGLLLLLIVGSARAAWVPRYYFFDRITWAPDGQSVAVIGSCINEETHETFADTLLVNVETGEIRCLSTSILNFVLSRDGKRMLYRGRWGLFEHDFESGVTRQVFYQHPFRPSEIVEYSYDRDGASAVCLRCSDEDPDIDGVYAYPLDGGEAVRLSSDSFCSPALMNFWQKRRRGVDPDPDRVPAFDRPVNPPGFPGTVWAIRKGLTTGVAVWGNGAAASDTLCFDCRPAMVSWPRSGGRAIVAVSPENIYDVVTLGDLRLLKPSEEPIHLARGQFEKAAWRDSMHAVLMGRPGVPWSVDVETEEARVMSFSQVPEWLAKRPLEPHNIWTIRTPGGIVDNADSASSRVRPLKPLGITGYGLEDGGGGRFVLSVGVFDDSVAAAKALKTLKDSGTPLSAGGLSVVRRPVSTMHGSFDAGSKKSPDGRRRIFLRSHPHMFRAYNATEVWMDPGDGGRPRLLLEAMANW